MRRLALSLGILALLLSVADRSVEEPSRESEVAPPPPAVPEGPLVFVEPNPFREGTQLRLEPGCSYTAPCIPEQLAYSSRHQALFLRSQDHQVRILDVKEGTWRAEQDLKGRRLTDMSLAPDESALFVADQGGDGAGGARPKTGRIHRFDLQTRHWATWEAPGEAYRVEAVDGFSFVLLGEKGWEPLTLNHWDRETGRITEKAKIPSLNGAMAYDPWAGRLYHAIQERSLVRLTVYGVKNGRLVEVRSPTLPIPTSGAAANLQTVVLSVDGRHLYMGGVQLDLRQGSPPRAFTDRILAASRDLAFAKGKAYDAGTGRPVTCQLPRTRVYAVSRDSLFLWAFDPGKKSLCRFALGGEPN